MTRINSAISVKSLTDEHLLAEHREIKRLCSLFRGCRFLERLPVRFCLGKGHILFFLDKFLFTRKRYRKIHQECLTRGFMVENYEGNWDTIPKEYMNDYTPTEEEERLLKERISERIEGSPKKTWHYYRKPITKQQAKELLRI